MRFVRAPQYNIYGTYHEFSVYGVYLYLLLTEFFAYKYLYKSIQVTTVSNKQYHRCCACEYLHNNILMIVLHYVTVLFPDA